MPGHTACTACAQGPLPDSKPRSGLTATLPCTAAIVAGLAVQSALKYLLAFGTVTDSMHFAVAGDELMRDVNGPQATCSHTQCRQLQQACAGQ